MFNIDNLTIAKSALLLLNLQHKVELGAEKIEIQLLDELYHKTGKELFNENKLLFKTFPIEIIHTPLYNGTDISIEYESDTKIFYETCQLAQLIAELKEKDILVVVHNETTPITLDKLGLLTKIQKRIEDCLTKFPNIKIGIENTSPYLFGDLPNNKILQFSDSCNIINNNINLSNNELVKIINNDRVGCVIDYCHALMLETYINLMYQYCNDSEQPHDNIRQKIFDNCAERTFLYHLSGAKGAGTKDNHGKAFHTDDPLENELLKQFFISYKEKHPNFDVPITLEVHEKDYLNCTNYASTRVAVVNTLVELSNM